MAIVVEEEKSRINVVRLGGWLVVIGVLLVAIYYIFFAAPQLVSIPAPTDLKNIMPVAQFNIQPEDILNSQAFQALKQPSFSLPTPQGPAAVGRQNPFLSP